MAEYPDEKTLRFIRRFDTFKAPVEDLRDFVIQNWHYEDYATSKGRCFELHTGGWSGNESIIAALEKSSKGMFWYMCWVKSERGGHYWFEIPQKLTRRYLKKYLAEKAAESKAGKNEK